MQTVYAHTVEGLFFKAVRTRIGPGLKDRLKPLGIDLDDKPADVPREKWAEALRVTATELVWVGSSEGWHAVSHLACDAPGFAAAGQNFQSWAGMQQGFADPRACFDQMLAIIEKEQ
jgi:uncharacterized protein (TIGR02265 family)